MDDLTIREIITYKHGKHNQIAHGNRYGKGKISIARARRLRKAGEFQKYVDRARKRRGTKPRRERGVTKPSPKKPEKSFASKYHRKVNIVDSHLKSKGWAGSSNLFAKMLERADMDKDYARDLGQWLDDKPGYRTLKLREMAEPFRKYAKDKLSHNNDVDGLDSAQTKL